MQNRMATVTISGSRPFCLYIDYRVGRTNRHEISHICVSDGNGPLGWVRGFHHEAYFRKSEPSESCDGTRHVDTEQHVDGVQCFGFIECFDQTISKGSGKNPLDL